MRFLISGLCYLLEDLGGLFIKNDKVQTWCLRWSLEVELRGGAVRWV